MPPLKSAVLVAAILAAGCQAPATKAPEAPAVDPLSVVDQYMAAWNAHDAARAASFYAPDVTYFDASVGVPQVGKDSAQKNVVEAFLTAAPDCIWTRDTSFAPIRSADGIAFRWTFSGTNTGPGWNGPKATGKHFSFSGATLIRLKGNKISFQGDFYDAYGFYKQLGLAQ
ncbi:MAG TPA: nuclear transport factor 2 family protein [Gemmatimonadales bacterium]|nr:nuclear transport factor 2 family protein [Gemmatimonadales bacterium]